MKPSVLPYECPKAGRLKDVSLERRVASKSLYQDTLKALTLEAQRVQTAYFLHGHRAVLVLEGWDAAGKGGAIRRLTERMDPRGYRVFPIAAPTEEERTKHHLYRFWQKIPGPGAIHIFDRSWYGRVLVERVEGFASEAEWRRGFEEINQFEAQLGDDGIRVIKVFVHISPDEQKKRFEARLNDPLKHWKLTEEDFRNRDKWAAYTGAIDAMLKETSTKNAPWQVVSGEDKKTARLDILAYVLAELERDRGMQMPKPDPRLIELARSHGLGVSS